MVTFNRVSNGEFQVLVNGVATETWIINGSLGHSGRGVGNTYGIIRPNIAPRWIGTLQRCKKLLVRHPPTI